MRGFRICVAVWGVMLLTGAACPGQSYDLSWFAIDGGGGTSTGGVYSVSGTIGQSDAGTMSGGKYTLTGGFWSASVTVQTSTYPELTIAASLHAVTISWPASSSGFGLQQTSSLSQPDWTPVSSPATTNGAIQSVTLAPAVGTVFYRLAK